jgi:hypothetical protein
MIIKIKNIIYLNRKERRRRKRKAKIIIDDFNLFCGK